MSIRAGVEKPEIQALPRIQDRLTFIYLERCRISRDNSSITVKDNNGVTNIPAATISVLLLGPGTDVTHRAMELIGDAGVTIIWVGEHGVRYYAFGRALTNHATLLIRQAQLVSNEKKTYPSCSNDVSDEISRRGHVQTYDAAIERTRRKSNSFPLSGTV